ncbi:PIR protein [Plasmodium vivax]|nr:PIR protein [Plasmodium vivax]
MALSPDNNWEKNLPDLPSYKKYTELDNVNISGDDNDYCKKRLESSEEWDKKFCNKIAKNLSILKNEKDTQKRTYNCYYFNHWLYDNIGKKYYDGNTKGKKVKVSEKLLDFVSLANSEHILIPSCKGNIYGKPEEWKEEKDLHDYFENHKDIKCNNSDKSKCEKYVNYVTYIKTLYDTKVDNCCYDEELDEYAFCEPYFKCENKYNPQNLLTELKKELQLLEKKLEAGGAQETIQAGKSEKPGQEESGKEKTKPEIAAAGDSTPKREDGASAKASEKESGAAKPGETTPAPATPVEEKAATTIPTPPEPALVKPAPAKPVSAKPPAEKPIAPESGGPKPVAAKPVASKPEKENLDAAESEKAKPGAAKPVEVQPKETVSEEESAEREEAEDESNEEETAEGVTVEEVTTEELVAEMPSTVQHEEALGSQPVESVEQGVHAISSYTTESVSNALPLTISDSTNTLGTTHEELDSNFFRNVIMAIASSRLESSYRKKKKKKGTIFEHNYYEEYEKELAMYGSEEKFLDSETDRLYLNYHPDQDSYY